MNQNIKHCFIKKYIFIAVILVLISFCFIVVFADTIHNNIKLNKMANELKAVDLPDGTEIVEEQSVLGKLNGNGNGMDYLATVLVKSDLSEDKLLSYYSECEEKYEICSCTAQTDPKLNIKYLEHGSIQYSALTDTDNCTDYYVVYVYQGGGSSLFDIRGH